MTVDIERVVRRMIGEDGEVKVLMAREEYPEKVSRSVFLAGPITGWREEAVNMLKDKGWNGVVINPVAEDYEEHYEEQVEWERKMLSATDFVIFWWPKVSNVSCVEFGDMLDTAKVISGYDKDMEDDISYIEETYKEYYEKDLHTNLEKCIDDLIEQSEDSGSVRMGGARYVPLQIWRTPAFQNWYQNMMAVGNRLDDAKQLWIFNMPKAKIVFSWVVWVKVWIESEQRYKENEYVLSRTDINTVVLYRRRFWEEVEDSEIVLVREFRSPSRTEDSYIRELPGGSSKEAQEPKLVALEEVSEEAGVELEEDRLKFVGSRQLMGTFSAHMANVFSYELAEEEYEKIMNSVKSGETFGLEEDSELTYLEVVRVADILAGTAEVDWSTAGMVASALLTPRWNV
jgi:ADP-ribose pyrophosphatase YjhB (NUDIX family)